MNQNAIAIALAGVMPLVRATGLLVSLATFQSSASADYPDGFPSGDYQDIAGLVALPCMTAPQDTSYIAADEKKEVQTVTADELLHVLFGDIYPTLNEGWREGWVMLLTDAVGNVTQYDVMGAGMDSQGQHSVAKVRLTTI